MALSRCLLTIALTGLLSGCDSPNISQDELEAALIKQQPHFNTLAQAIERHKERNGYYPTTLSDVSIEQIPDVTLPTKYKTLKAAQPQYELSRDKSFFRITYAVEDGDDYNVYAASSYSSLKKQWQTEWDPELFNWLEIQHYGKLYRQNRDRQHLDLTVQSLLDTARGYKGTTCNNFWHEWVIWSLGTGEGTKGYPPIDASAKVDVYEASADKYAYAFVVTEQAYPYIKNPLRIISEVHRFDEEKNAWELLQACGASD